MQQPLPVAARDQQCPMCPGTACPEETPRDDPHSSHREMLSPARCHCPPRAAPSQCHRHFLAQPPAKPCEGSGYQLSEAPAGAAPSLRQRLLAALPALTALPGLRISASPALTRFPGVLPALSHVP